MPKSNKRNQSKNKIRKGIYLDYASSTTPNPGSIHDMGVLCKKELERARMKVAFVLSTRPKQVIFTSGGTESNNLAIRGVVERWVSEVRQDIPHIIITNIEHPSVLETCKILERKGVIKVSIVPVEKNGIVDPQKIKKEIKENTILVSVMYANNEIGTIQPIKEIAKEIRHFRKNLNPNPSPVRRGVGEKCIFPIFHTDAVQVANYLDLNIEKLGVDILSLSGSKIENSGKVGLLYVKDANILAPIFYGGDQEMGFRPGTENVAEIVKFANALEFTQKIKEKESKRLLILRKYFLERLIKVSKTVLDKELIINGDLEKRLPNNVNITIQDIPSDLLVIELSARGIYVSAKSACKSGDGKVSYVIQAIYPKVKETDGSLRFSFGRNTTKVEIDYTVKQLERILTKLKKWYH